MFRFRSLFLVAVLLCLSLGASQRLQENTDDFQLDTLKNKDEFESYNYPLGDFSRYLARSYLGLRSGVEGEQEAWACSLIFGVPPSHFIEWIHPVSLSCHLGDEAHVWPLGEGVFRRAYTKHRLLLKGVVAEKLSEVLNEFANPSDVESPISSRNIAWGPSNVLKISSLRKSNIEANFQFSVECYSDLKTESSPSCALQANE